MLQNWLSGNRSANGVVNEDCTGPRGKHRLGRFGGPAAVTGTVVGVIAVLVLVALVAFLRAERKKDPTSGSMSRTVSLAEIRHTNRLDNVTYEAGVGVPDMACEVPPVVSVASDESPVDAPPPGGLTRQMSDV